MNISLPPARRSGENFLPMINVVFLLLIFFLISARLTPPEPFPVEPPESASDRAADGAFTLLLAASDQIGYRDSMGEEAALAALAADLQGFCTPACADDAAPVLLVRADSATPAGDLARLMPKLGQLGFARIDLVVVPK